MKKANKKDSMKTKISILKNIDGSYSRDVVAVGSPEEVETYKKQLVSHGFSVEGMAVEEDVIDGWSVFLRYKPYQLTLHQGLLFPKMHLDVANDLLQKKLSGLYVLQTGLLDLQEGLSSDELADVEKVLKIVDTKYEATKNTPLQVKML